MSISSNRSARRQSCARLRELRGEADPVYRHYASKVAAAEVLVPNGKLTFED